MHLPLSKVPCLLYCSQCCSPLLFSQFSSSFLFGCFPFPGLFSLSLFLSLRTLVPLLSLGFLLVFGFDGFGWVASAVEHTSQQFYTWRIGVKKHLGDWLLGNQTSQSTMQFVSPHTINQQWLIAWVFWESYWFKFFGRFHFLGVPREASFSNFGRIQ